MKFWIVPAVWFVFAVGVTYARFGRFPGDFYEIAGAILGFLVVSAVSGWVFVSMARSAAHRLVRIAATVGYVLAFPFAYLFAISGLLTLEILPVFELPRISLLLLFPLAIGFWGSLTLILGAALGFLLGNLVARIVGKM